ncbi:MAG: hypothetical protein RBT11_07425 [Desulfobacterales bacterium]|nr:hypothetical protein [Desulfobacterales bacterium]
MNMVSNLNIIPYVDSGYPIVVIETPDYALGYREDQDAYFQNSRFSKGCRFGRYVLDFEQETELYNSRKRIEPNAMQMIGTLINLYV